MSTLKWLLVRWHVTVAVFLLNRLSEPQQATRLRLTGDKIHARKKGHTRRDSFELALLTGASIATTVLALIQAGLVH